MVTIYYLGIDIGKYHHEAALIDDSGKPLGKTIRFANNAQGFEALISFTQENHVALTALHIGIEATGHYWLPLFSYLKNLNCKISVFNPLQSDALRSFYIRKAKTDKSDAKLIAEVIRISQPTETNLPSAELKQLKQLSRLRYSFVDTASDLKKQVISVLDQLFPEYCKMFSDIFGKASLALLKQAPTPDAVLAINTSELIEILRIASKNRLSLISATQKAQSLKQAANDSIGLMYLNDAFTFQLRLLLEQIELLEKQIHQLEISMSKLVENQGTYLTTIIGISTVSAAVILSEFGDISHISNPKQLVGFAGLDPSVKDSGNFHGTKAHMSKRGSPYLHRAIWQSAVVASNADPALRAYYLKLTNRGKPHRVAIGAVCRKLINIIFWVLKNNKPYEVRMPQQ